MQSLHATLVLADFADLLQAAVPIIFMILYGIAQLVGSKQPQVKPKPAPRPRPAPEPVGAAPRAAGAPPTLEESLRREVEDFLRRAQGQQPQKPAPVKQAQDMRQRPLAQPVRQAKRPLRPEPQREPAPRRLAEPLRPAPPPALSTLSTPAPMPAPTLAPLGSGVSQHVAQHLSGTAALAQHAQHLGADVALADERMEQHLQERFAHKLGSLVQQSAAPEKRAVASPAAQELVKLLTQPGGARQIIIASEILRRPEDRWS
jgi:hypothetical protein